MNIEITAKNRDDYLLVTSKGEIETAEELIIHADLIYGEFLKYNPTRILIYQMETEFPTGLSSYLSLVNHYIDNFATEVRAVKIAVVIQDKYKEIGAFWETVCTNRGFQYHAFTSLEEAETWLMKK